MKTAAHPASYPDRRPYQAPLASPPALPRGRAALALLVVLAFALAIAGCGGSSASSNAGGPTPPARPGTKKHLPIVDKVEITSPAIAPAGTIPSTYTCDGKNISPPLQWKGIPAGTAELQLDLIRLKPVNKKLQISWALAGIKPGAATLPAGKLPPGAIAGTNINGHTHYELCPAKGTSEEYVFVLFALPHTQTPQPGFDPVTQRLKAIRAANYEGFLVFTYPRHK